MATHLASSASTTALLAPSAICIVQRASCMVQSSLQLLVAVWRAVHLNKREHGQQSRSDEGRDKWHSPRFQRQHQCPQRSQRHLHRPQGVLHGAVQRPGQDGRRPGPDHGVVPISWLEQQSFASSTCQAHLPAAPSRRRGWRNRCLYAMLAVPIVVLARPGLVWRRPNAVPLHLVSLFAAKRRALHWSFALSIGCTSDRGCT